MSYADLKIMTRGGSDTDLEPSEEFPILFGLLTAPMNNSSTGTAGSGSKSSSSSSYLSKYFRKSAEVSSQNEPDSSAFSDDGMCISEEEEDEDGYTSYSDSDDDDDDDLGEEDGKRNDESVVSSNSGDECCPVIVTGGRSGSSSVARQDEIDRLPSSTTVDDEDYDDILFASHTQGILSSSIRRPNNHRCKALKRSYHQMSCPVRPVQESRSISRVVVGGGTAASKENGGDTEDEQVKKSYCFSHDGLENFNKREIQLNRLAPSPISGSSPEHLLQRKANTTEDLALHHNLRPPPLPQSQIIINDPQILLLQPLKRPRTDSDRTGSSSSLNHDDEEANTTGAYNNNHFNMRTPESKSKSEMYVGFSFAAIEKMRPTTPQKVAQPNPVIDSKIESFSNVVTDNSIITNALTFNNINNDTSSSNNNNNAHSTIPLSLLPNQVQQKEQHDPTDNNNYANNKLALKILSPQTTANNESNTKKHNLQDSSSSFSNNQPEVKQSKTEEKQEDQDCSSSLPQEGANADANLEKNLESYKCVHCDLIHEEEEEEKRHIMLASHCCRNTQKH